MITRKLLLSTALAGMMAVSPLAASAANMMDGGQGKPNSFWWPDQLNLSPLRAHSVESNPYGEEFNYAAEFKKLDLAAVKKDIDTLLTTEQDWWPADWGNYGPFFIRMAWHSAGTYRMADGRGGSDGGQQRFEPLGSWPDNANLDKARRLLWPVKQKYGRALSWGDLMVLAGNVAMENMGFKTYGFAGGRADDWEPDVVYWGPEAQMMASERAREDGSLKGPLAATVMGLIYVNPEGPNANHDPVSAAKAIRTAFGQMAMNDEETVALIAGGHTFGKVHGAHKPKDCVDVEPAAAAIEEQGLGWKNTCGKGNAEDTVTSGLEGAWTAAPTKWTGMYLDNLFTFDWEKHETPGGGTVWIPTDESVHESVPDAHIEGKFNPPIMLTTDLSLKEDPAYAKIAKSFQEDMEKFENAFARAWFKLTHRDMGPTGRYVWEDASTKELIWQDPLPKPDYKLIDADDVADLKADILASELTVPQLVRTAWASAGSFRASDMRGGADGARVRLAPQKDWAVNNPDELETVLEVLEEIRTQFNKDLGRDKQVSLADTIVIGGAAAIEKAAKAAGYSKVEVPVKVGRVDATQEQTDVASFDLLKPRADAFRNYYDAERAYLNPTDMLVDRADMLDLTIPEMTVLLGGMRVLDANSNGVKHGVFTDKPGVLSRDFFVNLLSMDTKWQKAKTEGLYEGLDRKTGKVKYTATPVDLVFGSNSELRTIAEVYAMDDAKQKFLEDFVAAWTKVMNLDRYKDGEKI